jgi:hypothetical protein
MCDSEPRALLMPEEMKDVLNVLKAHIDLIEAHCDTQPVCEFTEEGRKKCLALYKSLVQQIADFGGPVFGGLCEKGELRFVSRPLDCMEPRVQ